VPTAEQIRVPETLLKKRKNQDKITAEKAAALAEKRKVYGHISFLFINFFI
jgi:large subunit ribosomal protein L7e